MGSKRQARLRFEGPIPIPIQSYINEAGAIIFFCIKKSNFKASKKANLLFMLAT